MVNTAQIEYWNGGAAETWVAIVVAPVPGLAGMNANRCPPPAGSSLYLGIREVVNLPIAHNVGARDRQIHHLADAELHQLKQFPLPAG